MRRSGIILLCFDCVVSLFLISFFVSDCCNTARSVNVQSIPAMSKLVHGMISMTRRKVEANDEFELDLRLLFFLVL